MKTPCGVIRDLLPLYAENLTGEESAALVREHLAECEECSRYLKKLQKPVEDTAAVPSSNLNALKLVRKGIRKRKATAVWFSGLLVFLIMLTVFSHTVRPDYISYDNSGITVTQSENGDVYAHFADGVTSCSVEKKVDGANRPAVEIEAWTSLWDKLLGKTTPSVLLSSSDDKIEIAYYCDLSTESGNMTAVYGKTADEGGIVLPRLVLGYYFTLALAAAALLGLIVLLVRKNKEARRICGYLLAAPVSYVLSHLLLTTRFVSFWATGDFIFNCIGALAVYGVLVFGASLLSQRRQDRITG